MGIFLSVARRLYACDCRERHSPTIVRILLEAGRRDIYTDADTVELEYVAYDEDYTKYDNLLINAVTALFASRIVAQRRRDGNMAAALLAEYNQALSRARTVDCTQKHDVKYDGRQNSLMERSRRSFR